MRLLLRIILACCAAAPCLADEGFFADNQPPAVRAIWPSVYAFFVGTAGDKEDYIFVTAGHAIQDCKYRRRYLVENINQPEFESDGITVVRPPQRLGQVRLLHIDDAYDLAVVRARAGARRFRIGSPLKVGDTCDRSLHHEIYAVGFPGVGKRRSLHLRRDEKRWSKGEFVGLGRAEFRGVTSTYIATSVDSLPGNSGGPVVDESGALVGVVAQGVAGADNNFRYDVDPKKKDDWQTFLVPCTAVERLLHKSGLE